MRNVPICPGCVPKRWVPGLGQGFCQEIGSCPEICSFCWAFRSLPCLPDILCRAAQTLHLVFPGMLGFLQSLHCPHSLAFCRLSRSLRRR